MVLNKSIHICYNLPQETHLDISVNTTSEPQILPTLLKMQEKLPLAEAGGVERMYNLLEQTKVYSEMRRTQEFYST